MDAPSYHHHHHNNNIHPWVASPVRLVPRILHHMCSGWLFVHDLPSTHDADDIHKLHGPSPAISRMDTMVVLMFSIFSLGPKGPLMLSSS